MLSPEIHNVEEMVELTERLLERGLDYLQLTLHSSSLMPGLSPFTKTSSDVERLYARIGDYVEALARLTTPVAAVVADFAEELTPVFATNGRSGD